MDANLKYLLEDQIPVFLEHMLFGVINDSDMRKVVEKRLETIIKPAVKYFYVKCDEENNPPKLIDEGALKVLVRWQDQKGPDWEGREYLVRFNDCTFEEVID